MTDLRGNYVKHHVYQLNHEFEGEMWNHYQELIRRDAIRLRLEGDAEWLWEFDMKWAVRCEISGLLKQIEAKVKDMAPNDSDLQYFVDCALFGGRSSTDSYYDHFEDKHSGV